MIYVYQNLEKMPVLFFYLLKFNIPAHFKLLLTDSYKFPQQMNLTETKGFKLINSLNMNNNLNCF